MSESKEAKAIRSKKWREDHPGYYVGRDAERRLQRRYGIGLVEKQALIDAQDGKCALCDVPFQTEKKTPCIDHDHDTGEIRGILCVGCNVALGRFGDNRQGFRRVTKYLMKSCPYGSDVFNPIHHIVPGVQQPAPPSLTKPTRLPSQAAINTVFPPAQLSLELQS